MSEEIQHELEEKFQLTLADWINKLCEDTTVFKLTNDQLNKYDSFLCISTYANSSLDVFTGKKIRFTSDKLEVRISLHMNNYIINRYQLSIDELLSIGWYIKND